MKKFVQITAALLYGWIGLFLQYQLLESPFEKTYMVEPIHGEDNWKVDLIWKKMYAYSGDLVHFDTRQTAFFETYYFLYVPMNPLEKYFFEKETGYHLIERDPYMKKHYPFWY